VLNITEQLNCTTTDQQEFANELFAFEGSYVDIVFLSSGLLRLSGMYVFHTSSSVGGTLYNTHIQVLIQPDI